MSDESIQLSEELINDLVNVIVQHDKRADEDMMLGLQYLAAVTGYIAASYPGPEDERNALVQHLYDFTKHVCDDRAGQIQQQPAPEQAANEPAKGRSEGTDDPAIGIWKPE